MAEPWIAPVPERAQPELLADERTSLDQWLDYHRATLLTKCAGLDEQQLKQRPLPPSRLSLLGLVRHLTEVERWWFRMHAAQLDLEFPYDPDGVGVDFEDIDDADAAANLGAYVAECAASREALVELSLEDVVPSRGHHPERVRNVRWIYVHMIEEYARHNGQADMLREAIDGGTGE
jgi:hypothetical protein